MEIETLKDIIKNLDDAEQVELISYLLSNPSTGIKTIEIKFAQEMGDDFDRYSGQIRHEDTLFNQRITWLLAFQAFLIVPFFIIGDLNTNNLTINVARTMIGFSGIISGVLAFFGCQATDNRISNLTENFEDISATKVEDYHKIYSINEKIINEIRGKFLDLLRPPNGIDITANIVSYLLVTIIFIAWAVFLSSIFWNTWWMVLVVLAVVLTFLPISRIFHAFNRVSRRSWTTRNRTLTIDDYIYTFVSLISPTLFIICATVIIILQTPIPDLGKATLSTLLIVFACVPWFVVLKVSQTITRRRSRISS